MTDQEEALRVLDAGAKACYNMQKQLKAIDKELGKTRLDFINVRNIIFGKVKGKKSD